MCLIQRFWRVLDDLVRNSKNWEHNQPFSKDKFAPEKGRYHQVKGLK